MVSFPGVPASWSSTVFCDDSQADDKPPGLLALPVSWSVTVYKGRRQRSSDEAEDEPHRGPSPSTKEESSSIFTNLVVFVLVLLAFFVSSAVVCVPMIYDASMQLRSTFESGPLTGCGWKDQLASLNDKLEYSYFKVDAFAASDYAPVCISHEEPEPVEITDFDSAVEKAQQFMVTFSRDIQDTLSKIQRDIDDIVYGKLEDAIVPRDICIDDYNGLIGNSDVLFSFTEFLVVHEKLFLLLPWSGKSWLDILVREPLGWFRVAMLRYAQFYITMDEGGREYYHVKFLEIFAKMLLGVAGVVVVWSAQPSYGRARPFIRFLCRFSTLLILLVFYSRTSFWTAFALDMDVGSRVLHVGLLVSLVTWSRQALLHQDVNYRFTIHALSLLTLIPRAFFLLLATSMVAVCPWAMVGYWFGATIISWCLFRTTMRDLAILLCNIFPRSNPSFFDYYDLFGLTDSATPKEIEQAFRQLAWQYHPKEDAAPHILFMWSRMNLAKIALLDEHSRGAYDRQHGFGGDGSTSIFSSHPPVACIRRFIGKNLSPI